MSTPPVVQHPHTTLIVFLQTANRPPVQGWFDWASSVISPISASLLHSTPVVQHQYSAISISSGHSITINSNNNIQNAKDGHENQKSSSSSSAMVVAVIAGIIAVTAAVLVGSFGTQLRKAKKDTDQHEKINETSKFSHVIDANCLVCTELKNDRLTFQNSVENLVAEIQKIQTNYYNEQWAYTRGSQALLASSCAVATGALIAAPWLVTAGTVAGLFSVVYLALAVGEHWSDSNVLSQKNANAIPEILQKLQNPAPPRYAPPSLTPPPDSQQRRGQTLEQLKARGDQSSEWKSDCIDVITPTPPPQPQHNQDLTPAEIEATSAAINAAPPLTTTNPNVPAPPENTDSKTPSPHPTPSAPSIAREIAYNLD